MRGLAWAVLFFSVALWPSGVWCAEAEEVVVIVPASSDIESLSEARLRAIFGMRNRVWSDGATIRVFVLPDSHPLHAQFTKQILHTFPFNLRRIWDRRVYSGTGQSPTTLESETDMLEMISKTENSIGYVRRSNVNMDVKVVSKR